MPNSADGGAPGVAHVVQSGRPHEPLWEGIRRLDSFPVWVSLKGRRSAVQRDAQAVESDEAGGWWDRPGKGQELCQKGTSTRSRRAAQLLQTAQCRLLERLESGEIGGESDPQSGRWKVSRQVVDELVSAEAPAEDPAEEAREPSAEMLRGLVEELGESHRDVGHLRSRLDRARRAEREEKERLQAELEQEREGHRRERERADKLRQEAGTLREELESERGKGSLRKLFGDPG
jgi:hypothetical protein